MSTAQRPRATRADVARLAQVSPATVSYVLNEVQGQSISLATQEVVRRAAAQLGYRPNLAARNLAAGGSGVILNVIPRVALTELSLVVASRLSSELAQRGIVLTLQIETDDARDIADAIDRLHPIAVTSLFPLSPTAAAAAAAAGVPEMYAEIGALSDLNRAIGTLQVEHLISRGHDRIAFAAADDLRQRELGVRRWEGVALACSERHVSEPPRAVFAADGSDAAEIVSRWHRAGVTAVCASDDETGLVVLHGIRRAGLRCPDDLAVVGTGSSPAGFVSEPPLTTVAFDVERLIELSVQALSQALGYASPATTSAHNVVSLVHRSSS